MTVRESPLYIGGRWVDGQANGGLVCVNDATGYTHEIPFGGVKESGLGREGGREGIGEYMEVKSISLNIS